MKSGIAIFILLLSGVGCLVKGGDSLTAGIICMAIAAIIVFYKISKLKERAELEEQIRQKEAEHEETLRRAAESRALAEAAERERQAKSDAWFAVKNKWQVVMDEHSRLNDQIGVAYTIANNLKLVDSPEMQHVIELCKQDIALAEMIKKAASEREQVKIQNGWKDSEDSPSKLQSYPSFKRLAIIYEKQKDYDNAIAVCQRAIELGYSDDGTDGQMPGRIARLLRKKGSDSKKNRIIITANQSNTDHRNP